MERSYEFASASITLNDGRVLTKCDQCREMHSERNPPTIPPCEDCRGENLLEANQDAAEVYDFVRGQVITRHNGRFDQVLDINVVAIKTVMDLFQVRNQRATMIKVRRAFFHFLHKSQEKEA